MKMYRNLVIVLLVIVLLGGALYFVTNMPEKDKNETNNEIQQTEMFEVFSVDASSIVEIAVNGKESYTLTKTDGKWVLNHDTSIRIAEDNAKSLAYILSSVSAKQEVSDGTNASDFGFDKPTAKIMLTLSDGNQKEFSVGNLTLDGQNYYVRVPDSEKIYLKNTVGTESMMPTIKSLRNLMLIQAGTENLNTIQSVYISKKGNTAVQLENKSLADGQTKWEMTAPVAATMNGQVFSEKIVSPLENFAADDVLVDHCKNSEQYGFSSPYAVFSFADANGKTELIFGNAENGFRYLMRKDSDALYVISESKLTFLDVAYMDLMSNLIHVEYIKDISRVEICANDVTYVMEINEDVYKINGHEFEKETFSKLYQAVIGISLDSVDLGEVPKVSPEATVTYTRKDGSVCVVSFLPVSDRNYRVVVDGVGNCVTTKKNFTNVFNLIAESLQS